MTTRRRIGFALVALAVGLIVLGIGGSAWQRAQQPKFEGRTAGEWLSHFYWQRASWLPDQELVLKEAEIVFRSLGHQGQVYLVRDFLTLPSVSGIRSNLQDYASERIRRNAWVPQIRALESDSQRRATAMDILSRIQPSWPALAEGFGTACDVNDPNYDPTRHAVAIYLISVVGRDSHDALPLLLQALESNDSRIVDSACQSLRQLEGDLRPALPALLTSLERNGPSSMITDAIGDIGPLATSTLPLLHTMMESEPNDMSKAQIAGAIIKVDPSDEGAMRLFNRLLESDNPANLRVMTFGLSSGRITNNPVIADLSERVMMRSVELSQTFDPFALNILKQQAPQRAERLLEERLKIRPDNQLLAQLLALNARHETALRALQETLTRNLTEPGWLADAGGDQYLPLRYVTPEATNIVALLEKLSTRAIEQRHSDKVDGRWEAALGRALRHIELNGKLTELRERDAAGGN